MRGGPKERREREGARWCAARAPHGWGVRRAHAWRKREGSG